MWQKLTGSLFVRLFATFVVVVALAFASEAWFVIRTGRSAIERLIRKNLEGLARETQSEVLGHLRERGEEVTSWARMGVMDDILVNDRVLSIENLLLELRRTDPQDYFALTVVNERGEGVASTDLRRVGSLQDVQTLAPHRIPGGEMRTGGFPRSESGERGAFILAHPITSHLRVEPIGWLIADIRWKSVEDLIARAEGEQGDDHDKILLLLDDRGRVLAGDRDGLALNEPTMQVAGEGRSPDTLSAGVLSSLENHLYSLGEKTPSIGDGLPVQVAVFWRRDRALAVVRLFMLTVVAAAGLGLVLSAAASLLSTRVITRRLEKLAEGTGRLARGEMEFRVEEGDIGEFSQLARSFNSMAGELGRARAGQEAAIARWSSLVAHAPDFILTVDRSGRILFANRAVTGLKVEDLQGHFLYEFVPEEYQEALRHELQGVLESGEGASLDLEGLGPEGTLSWYSTRIGPLLHQEEVVGAILIVTDITERKRLEKEIVEVSEMERERMGRDLHDGLGQVLTGISLLSRRLQSRLEEILPEEAGEAGRIKTLIAEAIQEAKTMSRGLVPVNLDQGGLQGALRDLAAMVGMTHGVSCRVVGRLVPPIQDRTKATHLFRIAQEAVSNALQHGHAREIRITLAGKGGSSLLSIWNDGIPFNGAPRHGKGMGLRSMRYRAGIIGGTIDIGSSPDGGTIVQCRFS